MELGTARGLGSERERVLNATRDVLVERGYEAATMGEIAARAGVEEGVVADLFGGVEQCALALATTILAEVVTAVSAAYSADRSELESGLRGVMAVLELVAAKPSYGHIGFILARQGAPAVVKAIYDNGHAVLGAMLERGWEYSDLPTQPNRAAQGALGGIEAVIRRETLAGRAERLPALLPDLAYSAAVPFLGQEEALRLAQMGRELLRGTEWEPPGEHPWAGR